ncbi:outer membrane protein OmpA-like peptidoglycan-associated protein [Propionicimonas paludicola]|uniref:Outer membrane protein OmpA-like peptidoglycan-associated protein n=1 Tax=Propionicimonas paludicola TaxID=185243 RepID=A0A2A9CUP4_9ACTN|nr:OmpA family protein [Propionicimonas paludicola]PFG17866.1 outer membrane protein OmpA-like peptidoglycan-associated protein [Propionicimonas paludicola]
MDAPDRAVSPQSAAAPAPMLSSEILAWHEVTRHYRRPLGGWWWAAAILVPLSLALVSAGFGIGSAATASAAGAPSATTPVTSSIPSTSTPVTSPSSSASATVPPATAVPFGLVRVGETVTVTGSFADQAAKKAAIQALQAALGAKITVADQTGIAAGSVGLSAEAAAALGGAFVLVPDLAVQFDGSIVTLSGTAPSEQAVAAAEHAVAVAYPAAGVRSELIAAVSSPVDCATLSGQVKAVAGTGQITFGNKKSALTTAGTKAVDAAARLLKACPKAAVVVYGYTDGLGTPEGNKKVSQQRADAVKKLLRKLGVSNPIAAKGRSGANLIADNSTPAGQAANRRAEISVG